MIVRKKTWPDMFERVLNGEKSFDIRLADFECKLGDILVLDEYDPKTKKYTGRKIEKKITYILKIKDQKFYTKKEVDKYGFVVMSLE